MEENIENLSLVYCDFIGENGDGKYEYDLYFSETPDIVWNSDWAEQCPAIIDEMSPDDSTYSTIVRIISDHIIHCAQQNMCFSMQDCIDGIISLMWSEDEDNSLLLNVKFGEKYSELEKTLAKNNIQVIF